MEISVSINSCEPWLLPWSRAELKRALAEMLKLMTPAEGAVPFSSLELSLLDDADMAQLNVDFLGLPGPTNVLAFPPPFSGSVGSLALAVQTVCREAWLYGQALELYILKMLAHGMAHLMGYDHGADMDAQVEKAAAGAVAIFIKKENAAC